ncbi:MAG: tRNA (adenosine(37)-N6)-threonylcarbamoyltransferase complex transferase subunit TsaD [Nitrospinota bacterium]|nr:tRNA (adenosine(37)-N6)-threonylcarbamoyltransferase complex transferase subunit TsaD [Nitrospinota bacterium]
MSQTELITLGIETSCDETAVALLRQENHILSSIIASQDHIHSAHGGIVPELACRRHIELLGPMVTEAMTKAGLTLADIGLVAATRGPGLVGALLVGLSYAKALSWAAKIPFVGVNHLEGHVASALVQNPELPLPCLVLMVSGGHTELFLLSAPFNLQRLGGTRDDAAGEAFDKVARLLGLGYPGGPLIDKLAARGQAEFKLPVAMAGDDGLDFSFSGPKTAVKNLVNKLAAQGGGPLPVDNICASFQASVAEALYGKTRLAALRHRPKSLAVVGGVARNSAVRRIITSLGDELSIPVTIPDPWLCTDNAVMIAAAGSRRFLLDERNPVYRDFVALDALASWTPGVA